jgi:hypothetical protein
MLNIAFGMIVFEGDYVLKECLESVYPFAKQILIAEGPVKYWQNKGKTTSGDRTNQIIDNFPDPDKKIKIVHGQFSEKDEQCKAYLQFINDDIDYIWNLDSDEVYRPEDIQRMIDVLEKEKYTSVGMKSCSFYGGLDRVIGGFEEKKDNFLRIFKFYKGATWLTHRPPTIQPAPGTVTYPPKHLDSDTLYDKYGIQMYHYSYVFPNQVYNKIQYYKEKVSRDNCIDNYFENVYLRWMNAPTLEDKFQVEKTQLGVHEFKPEVRGESFTKAFFGKHPPSIEKSIVELQKRINDELIPYNEKFKFCWDEEASYQQMLDGARGILFPSLLNSDHVHILRQLITAAAPKNLIDLGCCSAEASLLATNFKYVGADLENIIENVSKVMHPEVDYVKFDASKSNFDFVKDYDAVLMNAFIDVLENGDIVLDKVLSKSKKVILHRQKIAEKTKCEIKDSYGAKTYSFTIGSFDFENILKKNNFAITHFFNWNNGSYSLLLLKQ